MNEKKSVDILSSWNSLNSFLRTSNESDCESLLKIETEGKKRQTFLLRIHSRLNKIRADRERNELLGQ